MTEMGVYSYEMAAMEFARDAEVFVLGKFGIELCDGFPLQSEIEEANRSQRLEEISPVQRLKITSLGDVADIKTAGSFEVSLWTRNPVDVKILPVMSQAIDELARSYEENFFNIQILKYDRSIPESQKYKVVYTFVPG